MRIGIVGLLHESNTFIQAATTYADFAADTLLAGEAVRDRLAGTHHEIGGFFLGLETAGGTAVPIFAARAVPYGPIDAETFEKLWTQLTGELERAGQLDGLLVAVHGAAVSAAARDADGEILTRLRKLVGDKPLVATLDAHANLSRRMVEAADALIAYRTNPHLDQQDRGIEAAALLVQTLQGTARPTMAAAFPPLAVNIERQCTSERQWHPILQEVHQIRQREGILSASILLGFPYADVEEMGSAAIVVSHDDLPLAERTVAEIGDSLWRQRAEFVGQLVPIDEALHTATQLLSPVCLLDMGDNVGGGSPGDGTWLVEAIRQRGLRGFACLFDPAAAEQARQAGIGARLELSVGGKSDHLHGAPVVDTFRVVSVHDGIFEEHQPRHGGARHFDQGLTVVVENERGLTLMLTSRRVPPFSLKQLTTFGVDPRGFQVLVAKGVNAPIAAYREVTSFFLRVDTPGVTSANLARLTFHHRRRPLFPFEDE